MKTETALKIAQLVDDSLRSLKAPSQPNLYTQPIHHAAAKADTPAITENIKLFRRVMERIEADVEDLATNSKTLVEFRERLGIYVQANPMTTEANMPFFMEAVNGVATEYMNLVKSLPPGGTQELTKEIIRTRTMDHLTKLGTDTTSQLRNTLEQSINNQKGMRYARDEMAKNIEGMTKNRAEVIARTETVYARNQAELVKAEAKGKEYFIVVSAGDCCDDCYETYDGNTFHVPEDEDMLPPLHPNCRCTATFFRTEEQAGEMADETSKPREE